MPSNTPEYNRNYAQLRRKRLREEGICTACSCRPSNGHAQCRRCIALAIKRQKEKPKFNRGRKVTKNVNHLPEYKIWKNMHARCVNQASPNYKHYGGRGIKVCERWSEFMEFFTDMGFRPAGQGPNRTLYTLERINNDGDYEPSNCKWATYKEQAANRRRPIAVDKSARRHLA